MAKLASRAAGHRYPALARWEQAQQQYWQRPRSMSLALERSPERLPYPFAVVMAGLLPRMFWPLKPLLGLWWLPTSPPVPLPAGPSRPRASRCSQIGSG